MNLRFLIFISLYLIIGLFLNLIFLGLVPFVFIFDRNRTLYMRLVGQFHRLLPALFWNVKASGYRPQKDSIPAVFVINHQTILDTLPEFMIRPHLVSGPTSSRFRFVPVFGWFLIFLGYVFVNRKKKDNEADVLRQLHQKLHNNISIAVAPEGKFNPNGQMTEFKIGAFKLACEAGVPVIAIRQDSRKLFKTPGGYQLIPGVLRFHIFDPIDTVGKTPEEVRDVAFQTIQHHTFDSAI